MVFADMQELRKASGQQLREVQMTQGEAVKQLRDERQQAERKEAQLKVWTMMRIAMAAIKVTDHVLLSLSSAW